MFEELILEDVTKRKLIIFHLLTKLPDGYYSINFLESNLDFSYSRVSYLLELIQQDLNDITQENVAFITDQGIHYDRSITYDQYYQYLITQSIPYLLILSIVYYPKDSLDDFCRKNFLSKASVIRKSKPLNDYFKQFNIKLNISQLKLTGEERLIRTVLYALIWFTSQSVNLPNPEIKIDYDKVRQNVGACFPNSQSYSAVKQIHLMLDIIYLRIINGYTLTDKTSISGYIPTNVALAKDFLGSIVTDLDVLEAEAQFSALLLILTPNYYTKTDPRFHFLQHYLKTEKNQAVLLFQEFWSFLEEKYGFDKGEDKILYGNVANIIFPITILRKNLPSILTMVTEASFFQNHYFSELYSSFKQFFRKIGKRKNFCWLNEQINPLATVLALLLFPTWEVLQKRKIVRIGLVAESNYLLTQQLINFLNELAFVEVNPFDHPDSNFDLIVATSSYLLPEDSTTPKFVFRYSLNNQKQYTDLYQILKDIQLNKNHLA